VELRLRGGAGQAQHSGGGLKTASGALLSHDFDAVRPGNTPRTFQRSQGEWTTHTSTTWFGRDRWEFGPTP
jgi:hypothetical protein